ncbi:MAG TPA: response regulator, partial [Allosphingosinicella sp.]|nr:response regulator [Allosphingosinicella sp.]
FSTKPVGKGTGLGLAQVYGIARQSGGTVRIDSQVGSGTTVHLLLKEAAEECADLPQSAPGTAARPARSISGASILVVDDDEDVRAFLVESLEALGHDVLVAESGEAALAALAERTPDLVLLDYAMPGMNGAEVARSLAKSHASLPVVFVTGYAESDQIEQASGAHALVLRKPFGIAELSSVLDQKLPPHRR